MAIPLSYTLRNLAARKLTTALTAAGMALVVFVFATVQMLEEGLRQTLVETGSPDNVVITRRSAGTDTSQMLFHWAYLNETIKKGIAKRTD